MKQFFGGAPESETPPNPEPDQKNKWFPANWTGHLNTYPGWARHRENGGYDFSLRLPEEVSKFPESVFLSKYEEHGGGSFQVSFRDGKASWRLIEIGMFSKKRAQIGELSAHIGDQVSEDQEQFGKILNKPPVDL